MNSTVKFVSKVIGGFFICVVLTGTVQAEVLRSVSIPAAAAYRPSSRKGEHLNIKITPPGPKGKDGRVLVEVYNRGKQHLGLIQFDVTLKNRGGFAITAPVKAEDLKTNMSGAHWIKIPQIKGAFPVIDEAIAENIKIVNIQAQEIKMKGYLELIKK